MIDSDNSPRDVRKAKDEASYQDGEAKKSVKAYSPYDSFRHDVYKDRSVAKTDRFTDYTHPFTGEKVALRAPQVCLDSWESYAKGTGRS